MVGSPNGLSSSSTLVVKLAIPNGTAGVIVVEPSVSPSRCLRSVVLAGARPPPLTVATFVSVATFVDGGAACALDVHVQRYRRVGFAAGQHL